MAIDQKLERRSEPDTSYYRSLTQVPQDRLSQLVVPVIHVSHLMSG